MTPEELRDHLLSELLPLWCEHGTDPKHGGFHSRLGPDLRAAPDPEKRLLVQTRQIQVFARAALDGAGDWALQAAQDGFTFLGGHFRDHRHGGWWLTATPEGESLDRTRDTYGLAFVILALATLFRASQSREVLEEAEHGVAMLERLADEQAGGYLEGAGPDWTPLRGPRRQNPHMHLLEALLALHEATGEGRYLELARPILMLLREHFVDPETGFLREHFAPNWAPAPGPDGRVVEPGHHFEWVWLLGEYERLSGDASLRPDAEALYERAARHGVDREHGGVFDQLDSEGRVLLASKRLWPQTEYLRALALRLERGEAGARERLERELGRAFECYLDRCCGGWHEQADREGRITSTWMSATSVYHIYGALSAAAQALARATTTT